MSSIELKVSGMSCGACVLHLTRALEAVEGVRAAHVDLESQTARIEGESGDGVALDGASLVAVVEEEGYEAVQVSSPSTPQISE